jgi:TonB-dependent starch-binding outer membrane protein SusC
MFDITRRNCMHPLRSLKAFAATAAAAAALLCAAPAVAAAQTGSVTGTVVDQATNEPLRGAQVSVAGTNLGTLTNAEGSYTIRNVPAGEQELRATIIGYRTGRETVTVAADEVATASFALQQTAIAVEGLVVTATGEQARRRELGNTVSQISVPDVELAPVNRFSDILQGRAAGVTVQPSGGTTGTGARIRIRGSASVSLSNEPLLIIDGVRVSNAPQAHSIGVGGQAPSRLEDINPEDIENIEILKGPAASALYGTAAANGVIQITTRRGRAGVPSWNAYTELGRVADRTAWPANFEAIDAEGGWCPTPFQALGICQIDDILTWNPLMDRPEREGGHGISNPEGLSAFDDGRASPFRDGNRRQIGVNVSGGGDVATYYFSAEREGEDGVFLNNELDRVSLRANVRSNIRDDLDLAVSTGYTTSDLSLPQNDNNILGLVSNGLLGFAEDVPRTRGYAPVGPDQIYEIDTRQQVDRFVGSANANWRPLDWLSFVGTAGLDFLGRHDNETIQPGRVAFADYPEGRRISNRIQVANYTGNFGGTATFEINPNLISTTSAGAQYHQEVFRGTYASGWQLLEGSESLAGTNARFAVSEVNQDVRTLGGYLQQQFGFNDRLFLTGAVRGDDNSAFGADFGLVLYPSLSASWVIGEEDWFPQIDALSSLRLRASYGQSGLRPGFRQALTFLSPVAVAVEGVDAPGFTIGGAGDPDLAPEISSEFEAGFDLGLLEERLGLEFTYYNKTSRDALVFRRLAPSLGVATGRYENIGSVRNEGLEALLNAAILDLPTAQWDATLGVSTNRNELLELAEGVEPIIFGLGGDSQRHQPGFPLGGYWAYPLEGWEVGENGVVGPGDVEIGAEQEYRGTPFPKYEVSLSSSVTLFDLVRLSALVDHHGGHTLLNSTEEFRCAFFICEGLNNPDAPESDQARAIAAAQYNFGLPSTIDGFLEDATFTKLREASITLMSPPAWTDRLRVQGLSLTLSGRNLATWTNYTGADPEMNFGGQQNFMTADFLTQPPVRYYTARVNLTF